MYTKDASIGVIYDNFKENQNYNYSKTVWKEIYTIVNGKLVKIKRVDGIFKEQQIIPEQIIFEEK